MKSVPPGFGSEARRNGDGLCSFGQAIARTTLNVLARAELKPGTMVRPAESAPTEHIPW